VFQAISPWQSRVGGGFYPAYQEGVEGGGDRREAEGGPIFDGKGPVERERLQGSRGLQVAGDRGGGAHGRHRPGLPEEERQRGSRVAPQSDLRRCEVCHRPAQAGGGRKAESREHWEKEEWPIFDRRSKEFLC